MQQGFAIADRVATGEHDIVADLFARPSQLAIEAVHRHDRPVQRPGQLLQQDDPRVAPLDVRDLVHKDVRELVVTDRPEESFGQDDRRPPESDRQRCDRAVRPEQHRLVSRPQLASHSLQQGLEALILQRSR